VIPVGSLIICTEQLPEEVVNRVLASDSKMLAYYFRITPDNGLLFGGRARFALSPARASMSRAWKSRTRP
jgi:hypothetical protein